MMGGPRYYHFIPLIVIMHVCPPTHWACILQCMLVIHHAPFQHPHDNASPLLSLFVMHSCPSFIISILSTYLLMICHASLKHLLVIMHSVLAQLHSHNVCSCRHCGCVFASRQCLLWDLDEKPGKIDSLRTMHEHTRQGIAVDMIASWGTYKWGRKEYGTWIPWPCSQYSCICIDL
jgi:hypothetical protein